MVSATSSTASTASSTASDAVYTKVDNLMQSQSAGVAKLNTALKTDQTKLSALGKLQSALASFQSVASALGGKGLSTAATPSKAGILQASTGASAVSGTYAVDVQQLAQGQVLNSAALAAANTKIGKASMPTTLKIEFGTTANGAFTAGDAATSKSLIIDSSNNTLEGIAAALKEAGLAASLVQGADGYALTLGGPDGAAGSMRVSVSGDPAVSDLLAYDPAASKNMQQASVAQDAILTVDGKRITSASNTVANALPGTSLTLTGKGAADVVVARDTSQIASNVATFVTAYNTLNAQLSSLKSGDLQSDAALGQVASQLSQILRTGGGSPGALAKAGVTVDIGGNLKLDSAKLQAGIASDADTLGKLFTNDGQGIADLLTTQIATLTGSGGKIGREVAATTKDLGALTIQKAALQTALTAQAQALVQLYSEQNSALNMFDTGTSSGAATSLFDMMA